MIAEGRSSRGRRALVLLACGVGAVVSWPAGAAAGSDPRDVPAVSQYVEIVPESEGAAPLDDDSGLPPADSSADDSDGSRKRTVSAPVAERIAREGGGDAAILGEIATLAAAGAPARLESSPAAAGEAGSANAYRDRRVVVLGVLLALTSLLAGG